MNNDGTQTSAAGIPVDITISFDTLSMLKLGVCILIAGVLIAIIAKKI